MTGWEQIELIEEALQAGLVVDFPRPLGWEQLRRVGTVTQIRGGLRDKEVTKDRYPWEDISNFERFFDGRRPPILSAADVFRLQCQLAVAKRSP